VTTATPYTFTSEWRSIWHQDSDDLWCKQIGSCEGVYTTNSCTVVTLTSQLRCQWL